MIDKIILILETQPRSGTHYTIDNLKQCIPDCGYCTVFENELENKGHKKPIVDEVNYKKIYFERRTKGVKGKPFKRYILKTHFFNTVEMSYVPKVKLFCYPYDTYWNWACKIQGGNYEDFKLTGANDFWNIWTMEKMVENCCWLNQIEKNYIRYEDYLLAPEKNITVFNNIIDWKMLDIDWSKWVRAEKLNYRLYWDEKYRERYGVAIKNYMKTVFATAMLRHYNGCRRVSLSAHTTFQLY